MGEHKFALAFVFAFLLVQGCDNSSITGSYLGLNETNNVLYAKPITLNALLVFTALEEGFFEDEGLKVITRQFSAGRLALDAVLTGNADFSSMSETPFMHSVLQGNDVVIVATISTHKEAKGIARKDKGISKPKDLKGKKIATLPGTNSDYFMHVFLEKNGLNPKDVQIVSLPPPEMVSSLIRGDIDAYFAWEPHIFFAKKELGDNSIIFEPKELYNGTANIIMKRDFVKNNPETVKKLIKALLKSEEFVRNNRKRAAEIAEIHTGMNKETLSNIYNDYNFKVEITQELIGLLDKESQWAVNSSLSKSKQKINFRDFMYIDALKEIDSKRVKVK